MNLNVFQKKDELQENFIDYFTRLKDNPQLLSKVLTQRISFIAKSDDEHLIDSVIDLYSQLGNLTQLRELYKRSLDDRIITSRIEEVGRNSFKNIVGGFSYSHEEKPTEVPKSAYEDTYRRRKYLMSKFKKLDTDQRIKLSDIILGDKQDKFLLYPMESLEIVKGLEKQIEIENNLIVRPQFYQKYPVTALKKSIENENYSAVGITFSYLRKKLGITPDENEEIKKFREERKYFDDLIKEMKEPRRAFENISSQFRKSGERFYAKLYASLSENADLLFDISKEANSETKTPSIYEDKLTAFMGFEELMTEKEKFNLTSERISEIKTELAKTFEYPYLYSQNQAKAIRAAELSEDYTALRKNFIESLQNQIKSTQVVYNFLGKKGLINPRQIVDISENYINDNINDSEKVLRALDFARLVQNHHIDDNIINKILLDSTSKSDLEKSVLNYMTTYNLHTESTRAYMQIQNL